MKLPSRYRSKESRLKRRQRNQNKRVKIKKNGPKKVWK